MTGGSVEQFLTHWFEIWMDHGVEAANAHFPNAGERAYAIAKQYAYSFMDEYPDMVPEERWAERRAE